MAEFCTEYRYIYSPSVYSRWGFIYLPLNNEDFHSYHSLEENSQVNKPLILFPGIEIIFAFYRLGCYDQVNI